MTQLALPLAYRRAEGEADFFVSAANADAVAWLDRWPDWSQPQTLLIGPPASGKSHLARIFVDRTSATLIEDIEQAADQSALFHAWNAATPSRPLLLTSRSLPRNWVTLPDLSSRLAATPTLTIHDPDDALLAAVLVKHFADRGLRVPPEVAGFVLARIDRSFAAIAAVVASLDALALATTREITIPLAREILAQEAPAATRDDTVVTPVIDLSPSVG